MKLRIIVHIEVAGGAVAITGVAIVQARAYISSSVGAIGIKESISGQVRLKNNGISKKQ